MSIPKQFQPDPLEIRQFNGEWQYRMPKAFTEYFKQWQKVPGTMSIQSFREMKERDGFFKVVEVK